LELVDDWSDSAHRLRWSGGASDGTTSLIAYQRDLGGGTLETQLIATDGNKVLLDVYSPFDVNCTFKVLAVSTAGLLIETTAATDTTYTKWDRLIDVLQPGDPLPRVSFRRTDSLISDTGFLSGMLWGLTYQGDTLFEWHALAPSTSMNPGWPPNDGSELYGFSAVGLNVLFSTTKTASLVAWGVDAGASILASPSPGGGYGSLATDGVDLVWLQGSGAFDAAVGYSQVDIMTSPFTLTAATLKPRKLRASMVQPGAGFAAVGGGYLLLDEESVVAGHTVTHFTLTRLMDGAYWELNPPAGFAWGRPMLYVNATELALGKNATPSTAADAGLAQYDGWSIVRLQIASLGAPNLPDAGM
jgi:hypothetical protein